MINAIFATDSAGNLGSSGCIPWLNTHPNAKDDMQWFKMHTIGDIVVMGRGTWDSIDMPHPLPKRENWVITSTPIEGVNTFNGDPRIIISALNNLKKTVWVIGGAKLITSLSDVFDRIYLSTFTDVSLDNADTIIDVKLLTANYSKLYSKKTNNLEHAIYEKISGSM